MAQNYGRTSADCLEIERRSLELDSFSNTDIYTSGSFETSNLGANQDGSGADVRKVDSLTPKDATDAGPSQAPISRKKTAIINSEELDDLRACLETFKLNRNILNRCYRHTIDTFDNLRKLLSITDDAATKILFMSDDDKRSTSQVLNTNPVILVVGQTNCGKTSLINEILQRSYLPTSEFPCTARLVRTKYSKQGYIRIKNERGQTLQEIDIEGKLKRVPRQYIVLEGEARESRDSVEQIVEVGIDDPMLCCGVEIIDAPGMCENEALDNIVQECLDGVLQVVLYVIDGNTSLRRPDVAFLYRLKRMAPNMNIIYVCNKVEEDECAKSLDGPSDDEDVDPNALDSDDDIPEITRDKGQLAFLRLKKAGIIDQEETMQSCSYFHPISCSQVRKARRMHTWNPHLVNFHNLLSCLIKIFQDCVNKHLVQATSRLLIVQKRTFDFFIADKFLNVPRIGQLPSVIKKILEEEKEHFIEMRTYIQQQEEEMYQIITKYLHGSDDRNKVIADAGEIVFTPIKIGDEVQRNYVINECRKQVRDFVLMKVTKDIENKIRYIKDAITKKFGESFQLNVMQLQDIGPVSDILQEQLEGNYMLTFDTSAHMDIAIDANIVKEGLGTRALNVFENVKANTRGIYLDAHWKRDTAKSVFKGVDGTKLAWSICSRIHSQLQKGHENFIIAMQQINCLYSVRQRQTQREQKDLLDKVPDFAANICRTESLQSTVEYGPVKLAGEFGRGSRAVVYSCFRMKWSQKDKENSNTAAKLFREQDIPEDFAPIYNYLRLLPKADHFLRPLGVAFTCDEKFTVLLPKVDSNLYAELASNTPLRDRLTIVDRLRLALDIASACSHAAEHGFRLTDLRPNNITLLNIGGRKAGIPVVKLHVVKWKDENIPYPDNQPPFHFAPEAYKRAKTTVTSIKNTNKKHDSYSMAIITWLLFIGEFIRPPFAMGDNDAVQDFVIKHTGDIAPALLHLAHEHCDSELKKNDRCMKLIEKVLKMSVTYSDSRYDIVALYNLLKTCVDRLQREVDSFESRV